MSVGETNVGTEYTVRFVLPDLIERGAANTLRCPVYLGGALVAPSAGTVSIYDAANVAQVSGASVTITGSVATYAYSPSASLPLGEGWRVEWALIVASAPINARNDAALVRSKLRCPITDQDLYQRVSALNPSGTAPIHALSTMQDYVDGAWQEINRRLIAKGNRPNLVLSPYSFFDVVLNLALSLVFEDFQTRLSEVHAERAATYRERYEAAWREVSFLNAYLQDGAQADPGRRRSASPVVMLCGRAR